MAVKGISWLHLSDWHQGAPHWDRKFVCRRLVEDAEARAQIAPELKAIDFVVFSGDFANRGKRKEFDTAWQTLIEPICKAVHLGPERVFIVAGNHDLDRSRFDLLPTALCRPAKSRDAILPWLDDEERRESLLVPFRDYSDFLKTYLPHQKPWASASVFEAGGLRIGVAGLNSALLCGRKKDTNDSEEEPPDRGNLVVGEPQVHAALDGIVDADLKIAIMHHPFDWLSEFDRNDIRHVLCSTVHFVLSGHVHQPEIVGERSAGGDCVIIPAGASYDRRNSSDQNYVNSFNYVHVDPEAGTGVAYIRSWSEKQKKWRRDDETAEGGKFTFALPRKVARPLAESLIIRGREYRLVPAGSFVMGTTAQRAAELGTSQDYANEVRQHEVTVAAFYIGQCPVTNREYKEFVDGSGRDVPFRDDRWSFNMNWDRQTRTYKPGRDDHPVTLVSWFDAAAYCCWLGGRLPTEAEWEKAARGTDALEWPWGNTWQDDRCNCGSNGVRDTTPVKLYGERGQSPYGVWDMAGNVWEWCSSIRDQYPYSKADGREVSTAPGKRVQRGGAWLLSPEMVRCAVRAAADPRDFGFNVGFRVVLEVPR